jgi:hypothetical protein
LLPIILSSRKSLNIHDHPFFFCFVIYVFVYVLTYVLSIMTEGTSDTTAAAVEEQPLDTRQEKKQQPPASAHPSEKPQGVVESKPEAKPGPPGGPGGVKPFGPVMGPAVEYPKGLKLYSIIISLYLAGFLTALVGHPLLSQASLIVDCRAIGSHHHRQRHPPYHE